MNWIKGRRPSPSMLLAGAALVVALAGTAIAGPLATNSLLSKREKKQTKKIARKQIKALAPGLSVASAQTANNSSALGGVSLADLNPAVEVQQPTCNPVADFGTDCLGPTLTTNRTADILVFATGTWHSDGAIDSNFRGLCRIERNDVTISATLELGSENDDTSGDNERVFSISELDEDRPPGAYHYAVSCDLEEGDFDVSDLRTYAVAVGT
jgi:hypothetical protein